MFQFDFEDRFFVIMMDWRTETVKMARFRNNRKNILGKKDPAGGTFTILGSNTAWSINKFDLKWKLPPSQTARPLSK